MSLGVFNLFIYLKMLDINIHELVYWRFKLEKQNFAVFVWIDMCVCGASGSYDWNSVYIEWLTFVTLIKCAAIVECHVFFHSCFSMSCITAICLNISCFTAVSVNTLFCFLAVCFNISCFTAMYIKMPCYVSVYPVLLLCLNISCCTAVYLNISFFTAVCLNICCFTVVSICSVL